MVGWAKKESYILTINRYKEQKVNLLIVNAPSNTSFLLYLFLLFLLILFSSFTLHFLPSSLFYFYFPSIRLKIHGETPIESKPLLLRCLLCFSISFSSVFLCAFETVLSRVQQNIFWPFNFLMKPSYMMNRKLSRKLSMYPKPDGFNTPYLTLGCIGLWWCFWIGIHALTGKRVLLIAHVLDFFCCIDFWCFLIEARSYRTPFILVDYLFWNVYAEHFRNA